MGVIGENSGMEVSREANPRSGGKTEPADIFDKMDDVFWDAYWTLDDDDQQPEAALSQL